MHPRSMCVSNVIRMMVESISPALRTLWDSTEPGGQRVSITAIARWPEPKLAGVGPQEHYRKLRQSLSEAEAVLVLNHVIAALVEPYCSRARIVP
jgi:hypothetical protein